MGGYSPNLKSRRNSYFEKYTNLTDSNLNVKKWGDIVRNGCAAAAFFI